MGATSLGAVGGVWSVITALASTVLVLVVANRSRLAGLRETMGAGAHTAALPILSVASLVGFGAVVASLPSFEIVKNWVLSIEGGPLLSLAVATNVLAALTGSASGGLTIALDALGPTYMQIAAQSGIDPALMHRVAVIGPARSTACLTTAPSWLCSPFARRPTGRAISTSSWPRS